jgi:hypothetical protein
MLKQMDMAHMKVQKLNPFDGNAGDVVSVYVLNQVVCGAPQRQTYNL